MTLTIGLLHPGHMGASIGAAARAGGSRVLWAAAGRSAASRARAATAGLEDAGDLAGLVSRSDVVISVCPPEAARAVAAAVAELEFGGCYLDANAVSSATVRDIAVVIERGGGRCVDGGIVGPPAAGPGTTRLYLSGREAERIAGLFAGSALATRVLNGEIGSASALKVAYAAWTKGSSALLLAVRALARVEGIEEALLGEWAISLPELEERSVRTARRAAPKAWRFAGEMEEIAGSFAAAGLPDGFHLAAAELFRRLTGFKGEPDVAVDEVLGALPTGVPEA